MYLHMYKNGTTYKPMPTATVHPLMVFRFIPFNVRPLQLALSMKEQTAAS